ncbi:sulfite exporter TauE/SafE family protein [Sulfurimonas sediminis]|uniref:Probable membrane transporter protein n=1 Tax=Sulfurimonas sediminis TaxID=2590020 RepID=A0A7M1B1V5_9BACT|nr:sulfite exporter TauE/SafE family protein [Sulfurimonas sediminis]QOP43714.1 sulfite exporter TauE/SafE family protein [Sulfurimonas sediminis]
MIELILLGTFVGLLSGLFGIGGGTILVPLLLLLGYETKIAIGISVIQMVFSSVYGSYLNNKKGTLDVLMVVIIGLGGFTGALLSGNITASFSDETLEMVFLAFAVFALIRLFMKTHDYKHEKKVNKAVLFVTGFVIGAISMSIGVGGSLILVPILVGFLHVPLKKATSAGLFFVVFSSVSGLISHTLHGHVDYTSGIIIGLASLAGVYAGIHLKHHILNVSLQKKLLTVLYLIIVIYLLYRIF